MDMTHFEIQDTTEYPLDLSFKDKKESSPNSSNINEVVPRNTENDQVEKTFEPNSSPEAFGKLVIAEENSRSDLENGSSTSGMPHRCTNCEYSNSQEIQESLKPSVSQNQSDNNPQGNENINSQNNGPDMMNSQQPGHLNNQNTFIPKMQMSLQISGNSRNQPYTVTNSTERNILRPRIVQVQSSSMNNQIGSQNTMAHSQQVLVRPSLTMQGIGHHNFQPVALRFAPQCQCSPHPNTSGLRPQTQRANETQVRMNSPPNFSEVLNNWESTLNTNQTGSLFLMQNSIKAGFNVFLLSLIQLKHMNFSSDPENSELSLPKQLKSQEKCLKDIDLNLEYIETYLNSPEMLAGLTYKKDSASPGTSVPELILRVHKTTKEIHEMCLKLFEDLKNLLEQKKYAEAQTSSINLATEIVRKLNGAFSQSPVVKCTIDGSIIDISP